MISAPRSARYSDPNGPAPYCSTATTRIPASGAGRAVAPPPSPGGPSVTRSASRDPGVHRVRADVVPVELDAEAGPGRERVPAVADPRRHVGQLPEERVALLVEALHEGVVRDARGEVCGDLRLLVMAQLDAVRGAQAGRLAPDRRAAGPRRVEVGDVDRAVLDQVAKPPERDLALAGRDRDPRLVADVAHPAPVVRPADGLLEPPEIEIPDSPAEVHRVAQRVPLVRVDHDREVRPRRLTGDGNPLGVLGRRATPHLELDTGEARVDVGAYQVRRLAVVEVVVTADHTDRELVGDGAPDPVQRL